MNNSEKILKSISNLLEKSILTSKDFQKELSDDLRFKNHDKPTYKFKIKAKNDSILPHLAGDSTITNFIL